MPVSGALDRIRQNLDRLPPGEVRIAQWILDHSAKLPTMTVRELAAHSQGSQAAVMRLCDSLQFGSFMNLKMSIVADLSQNPVEEPFMEIDPESDFHAVMLGLESSLVRSVQNTLRGVHEDILRNVTQYIVNSHRIVLFGSGASSVAAEDLTQKLQRLGLTAWHTVDFHSSATLLSLFGPDDVLLIISYSGHTTDGVELARMVHDHQGIVVAISAYGYSPLSEQADIILPVVAQEARARVGATASLVASLAVVNALLLYIVNAYPQTVVGPLQLTRKGVEAHQIE
ncbi:hypothetical protein BXT84_03080 [Sulfobacillus thermotolerans]|uniref:RpiR family transcriptional regulator n=1 Tax=Sulfobacillus thermotolerans TaxID=338644 RepID=A0ABN5GY54_9FIRM|nr:hypothetical protein BXT84_03080 [Sulfobacillus thermotolerans]